MESLICGRKERDPDSPALWAACETTPGWATPEPSKEPLIWCKLLILLKLNTPPVERKWASQVHTTVQVPARGSGHTPLASPRSVLPAVSHASLRGWGRADIRKWKRPCPSSARPFILWTRAVRSWGGRLGTLPRGYVPMTRLCCQTLGWALVLDCTNLEAAEPCSQNSVQNSSCHYWKFFKLLFKNISFFSVQVSIFFW